MYPAAQACLSRFSRRPPSGTPASLTCRLLLQRRLDLQGEIQRVIDPDDQPLGFCIGGADGNDELVALLSDMLGVDVDLRYRH
jgi:hypothetical protein